MLTLHAVPASAGFWAWLEEFSGPGPFSGTTATGFTPITVCTWKDIDSRSMQKLQWTPGLPDLRSGTRDAKVCLFADITQFKSIDTPDERYNPLNVWKYDFGGSYPLAHGLVELGAGAGVIHFSNERDEDTPVSVTRFTVTPLRVVTRPFLFLSYLAPTNKVLFRATSSFKFYIKETAVYGKLTACQFGADFTTEPTRHCDSNLESADGGFTTDGDMVRSYGVLIDLTELLPLLPFGR
jgi:hypothetical protein